MIKNIKKIQKELINLTPLFFAFLCFAVIIIFSLFLSYFSFAQGQSIPICSSPNSLLTVSGPWQRNRILFTSINPGILNHSDLYFSNIINYGSILTASGTWLFLNKGLMVSGPSYNFDSAGAIYFRDLTKSTGIKNKKYNEFSIFMPTSTNNLEFFYTDVVNNISRSVMTISTSGDLIVRGNINNFNNIRTTNISVLDKLSIGTTSQIDKLYIYSPNSDQYITINSGNVGGNLKLGTLFNPAESVIRFKEIFKIFYSNQALPILTINNQAKIGINTTTPVTALDVSGDIRASGDIITNRRFCLGNNCINNWSSGITGSGVSGFFAKWTSNTSIGISVLKEIPSYIINNDVFTNGVENMDSGGFIARRFCLKTNNNDLSCLDNWPPRPAVALFYRYIAGHEYWNDFLSNLITSAEFSSVSNQDPYIRPGSDNYDNNLGRGYPYIRLHDIINRIGIDINDPLATKWFILAYSYRQPFINIPAALFIEEGDNLNPWYRYIRSISEHGTTAPDNINDVFIYCYYQAPNGTVYAIKNKNECDQIRNNDKPGYAIISYTYAKRDSDIKGYVRFQIRLEPANQRTVCTKRDYLNSMSLATWGKPQVINLRISRYRYPNLVNDPCLDGNRMPNLHSLIMGRFVVNPYPTSTTTDPSYIPPTSISNFLNDPNANFTLVIKSLGVAELLSY